MFLRKILGRFLTTEPGQQLELIPATPSIQQYPQQIILPPCNNCISIHQTSHQQLNQSQVPYPQHFNTSLNSSSVSSNQPVQNPFLTSALIQTPSSPPPPTPSFQMPTSQDNTATLINSYLTLLSQSQAPSTPPLTASNRSSQHIYPNSQHTFQSSSSTLGESHHTPPTSSHCSNQSLPSLYPQNHQAVYIMKLSSWKK